MSVAAYGGALSTGAAATADNTLASGFGFGEAGMSTVMPAPEYTPDSIIVDSTSTAQLPSLYTGAASGIAMDGLSVLNSYLSSASYTPSATPLPLATSSDGSDGVQIPTPTSSPWLSYAYSGASSSTLADYWTGNSPSPVLVETASPTPQNRPPWAVPPTKCPNGYTSTAGSGQHTAPDPYTPQYSLSPIVEPVPLVVTGTSFMTTIGTKYVTINPNTMDISLPTPTPTNTPGAYTPPARQSAYLSGAAATDATPTPYATAYGLSGTSTATGAYVTAGAERLETTVKGSVMGLVVALAAVVGGLVV